MYAGRVVRGAIAAALTVVGLAGCFRGSFLDDTCERLPGGCDGSGSTGGGSSSSGGTPTSGAASSSSGGESSSGTTGMSLGLKFDGPAFRIDVMQIVDPHLFVSFPLCFDGRDAVNMGLADSLDAHETNLILLAKQFDADAPTQEFWLYRAADCPVGEDYCLLDDVIAPTVFVSFNRDTEDCLVVDEATVNPGTLPELVLPGPPCVVSPKASLPIQLTPDLSPITFYQGQFAARYEPSDQEPTALRDAVLFGFIPKTQANMLEYNYNDMAINLWSVIRGSDHPQACPADAGHLSDVDLLDLDPDDMLPAEPGVFVYLNFTATKIDFYAPAPP